MKNRLFIQASAIAALGGLLTFTTGCEQLPGSNEAQGATIGGVSGAAIGAAVGGSEHRLLGALIGGAVGAGGGYLIGANTDKIRDKDQGGAQESIERAQSNPATPTQARNATTGDVNNDGFVTMDEVVALEEAGYSDREILSRLEATGQVFELTSQQEKFLQDRGVSQDVIRQMRDMNREQRQRLLNDDDRVIGRPANDL